MRKLLDRYYLVLYRGYENHPGLRKFSTAHETSSLMSYTLAINVFSIIILIDNSIILRYGFWAWLAVCLIIGPSLQVIIKCIYNKKRRDILIEKYYDENCRSRREGVLMVVLYEIFSVMLLVAILFFA